MENIAAEQKVILTIVEDSPLGIVLLSLLDKAKRFNNDKGNYSVEYFAEDMISRGATSFNNYLDADKERRQLAKFNVEIAKLTPPNPSDAEAMARYGAQIAKLQAKHGIGGSRQEV